MANVLEIAYKINGSPEGLKNLNSFLNQVANSTGMTAGQFKMLQSVLTQAIAKGEDLGAVYKRLGTSMGLMGSEVAGFFQKVVLAHKEAEIASRKLEQQNKKTSNSYRELSILARGLSGIGGAVGVGVPGGPAPLMGMLGLGGSAGVAVGIAAAIAGLTLAFTKLASVTGEYAHEQENLSSKTGLSLQETQRFGQIAALSGVNVGALTTAMRTLSKGMSESTTDGKAAKNALQELGLSASVAFEAPGKALNDIMGKLSQLPAGFERDRLAVALFGRSAMELLPLVDQFGKVQNAMKDVGTMTDENVKKATEYDIQVKALGQQWDNLVHRMGMKAIGIIQIITTNGKGQPIDLDSFLNKGPAFMRQGKLSQGIDLAMGAIQGGVGLAVDAITGRPLGTSNATDIHGNYLPGVPRPQGPNLNPATPDLTAEAKARRSAEFQRMQGTEGNARQQDEAKLSAAKQREQDAINASVNSPFDKGLAESAHKASDEVKRLQAAIEGLKKAAEPFADKLAGVSARYGNPGDPEMAHLEEMRHAYTELERGAKPADKEKAENDYYKSLARYNEEMKAEIVKFQAKFEDEGLKTFNETAAKLNKPDEDKFKKTSKETAEGLAERYKEGKLAFEELIKAVSAAAKQQMTVAQIQQAQETGLRQHLKATGGVSEAQASQMDLTDQLNFIEKQRQIQVSEYSQQANAARGMAANSYGTDKEKYLNEATEAEAKAKEAETKATLENIEAINKFQEAADAAANALKEKFGSFVEGLLGASEKGKSGEFVRNFFQGQINKIGGNFAESIFSSSGMAGLIPGLPGGLGKGTIFAGVPKNPLANIPQLIPGQRGGEYEDMQAFQTGNLAPKPNPSVDANTASLDAVKVALDNLNVAISGGTTGTGATAINPSGLTGAIGDPSANSGGSGGGGSAFSPAALAGNPTAAAVVASAGGDAAAGVASILKTAGVSPQIATQVATASKLVARLTGSTGGGGPKLSTGGGIFGPTDANGVAIIPGLSDQDNGISADDLDQLAGGNILDADYGANDINNINTAPDYEDILGFGDNTGGGNPSIGGSGTAAGTSSMAAAALSSLAAVGGAFTSAGKFLSGSGGSQGMAITAITGTNGSGASVGTMGQIGAGIGAAGDIFGGFTELMGGLKTGGAKGAFQDVAGVATMVSAIFPPAAIVAMGANLISSLFGDPKAIRRNKITEELQGNQYNAPNPISISETSGGLIDTTNYRGQNMVINARPTIGTYTQVNGFSAVNGQHNDLLTTPERYVMPGALLPVPTTQAQTPTMTVQIQALDTQSILNRAGDIAQAVRHAIQGGHAVSQTIQNVVKPH